MSSMTELRTISESLRFGRRTANSAVAHELGFPRTKEQDIILESELSQM